MLKHCSEEPKFELEIIKSTNRKEELLFTSDGHDCILNEVCVLFDYQHLGITPK